MQKDFAVDFLESNLEPARPGQSLVDVFDRARESSATTGSTTSSPKVWHNPKFKRAALYFVITGLLVLGLAILLHPPLLERPGEGKLDPKQVAMWVGGSGLVAGVASLVVVKP
jgi:hypothetical protein